MTTNETPKAERYKCHGEKIVVREHVRDSIAPRCAVTRDQRTADANFWDRWIEAVNKHWNGDPPKQDAPTRDQGAKDSRTAEQRHDDAVKRMWS